MGKGKRSKERNNENIIRNSEAAAVATNNKTNLLTKISLIVIAVVLVATLILVYIQSSGLVLRVNAVYETENFKFTGTMMQYLVNAQYQNFYSQYGAYASIFGLDSTKSIKDQAFNLTNSYISLFLGIDTEKEYKDFKGTWYDFFWNEASNQAKSALAICEAAKKAGVKLGDEEYAKIQETIDAIYADMDSVNESNRKTYAEQYGQPNYVTFGSIKDYLNACYGTGVSIKDIRKTLEIMSLSEKYYNMVSEDELEALKTEAGLTEIKTYYEGKPSDYYKADYLSFTFKVTCSSTEDEKKWNTFIDDVNEALDHAKALSECTSEEEFKTYLIKYWFDEAWQDKYDTTITDLKKKDNDTGDGKVLTDDDIPAEEIQAEKKEAALNAIIDALLTEKEADELEASGDTAYDGAIDAVRESVFTTLKSKYDTLKIEMKEYDVSTDLGEWLFNENRQPGETKYFPSIEATLKDNAEDDGEGDPDEAAPAVAEEPDGDESTGENTDGEGSTPEGDGAEEEEEEERPRNWNVELETKNSETGATEKKKEFPVEVAFALKPRYVLEDLAREFGHVLLSYKSFIAEGDTSEAGKEKAKAEAKKELERLLEEFKANGEVTKESFESVAKEWKNGDKTYKTEDSGVFYEDVIPGMMVESVEDWLFDSSRKVGDMEIVESDYGYHLMFLESVTDIPAYLIEARSDLYNEKLENMMTGWETTYAPKENVDFVKKNLNFIG